MQSALKIHYLISSLFGIKIRNLVYWLLCTDYWWELNKMQARLLCTLLRSNIIKTFYGNSIRKINNDTNTINNQNVNHDNNTTNNNSSTNRNKKDSNKNHQTSRRKEDWQLVGPLVQTPLRPSPPICSSTLCLFWIFGPWQDACVSVLLALYFYWWGAVWPPLLRVSSRCCNSWLRCCCSSLQFL